MRFRQELCSDPSCEKKKKKKAQLTGSQEEAEPPEPKNIQKMSYLNAQHKM